MDLGVCHRHADPTGIFGDVFPAQRAGFAPAQRAERREQDEASEPVLGHAVREVEDLPHCQHWTFGGFFLIGSLDSARIPPQDPTFLDGRGEDRPQKPVRLRDHRCRNTVRDIAEQHGVNVNTARKAVTVLEAEGLVTPVRRRGTVARPKPPMRRLGTERYAKSRWKFGNIVAFAADREASGAEWKPTDQTNTVEWIPADSEIAEAYDLEPGTTVLSRTCLVNDKDQPAHRLTSYYRAEDVKDTPLANPTPGPAGRGGGFAVLTLQGLEPDHISETMHARMPTPEEAKELELPAGEPVVLLERHTYTAQGRLVEFARGVHAASRFTWTYTFPIPD